MQEVIKRKLRLQSLSQWIGYLVAGWCRCCYHTYFFGTLRSKTIELIVAVDGYPTAIKK